MRLSLKEREWKSLFSLIDGTLTSIDSGDSDFEDDLRSIHDRLLKTYPDMPRRSPCPDCNGKGESYTINNRGKKRSMECWSCDGTGKVDPI